MTEPIEIDQGLYQLSLIGLEDVAATTAYLIKDEKNILIETGASSANAKILQALDQLHIGPGGLDAIVVTHVHLDHAGGAGLLMAECPGAELLIHPAGAPHLINTAKLEASARKVYGSAFEELFHPLKDVDPDRVRMMEDGATYEVRPGRHLSFHHALGHALHHLVVLDSQSKSLFTGDAAGMYYPRIKQHYNVDFALPASTPSQFDPEQYYETLGQLLKLHPRRICFAHYGSMEDPAWVVKEVRSWLPLFGKEAHEFWLQHHRIESLKKFLLSRILDELEARGVPRDNESLDQLIFDTDLNAQGLMSYFKRLGKG